MSENIPPKPDRQLVSGLAWHYDEEINEWVIANAPMPLQPIISADQYLSLPLKHLKKAPSITVVEISEQTSIRVKNLFSLSNLKNEAISEQRLTNGNVKLGLPLYEEDMTVLIECEQ